MNSNVPTGTVTFLFTDIEGSTKLAQEYPDQWEALRGRHHAILRSAMDAYNGFVFQIIGDAFCVAFHTALDALNAAVEAQQLLLQEAWSPALIKVRMGINTGTAHMGSLDGRAEGYRGYTTMARVQRVMSIGHGGQILLSNTACELVRGELPTDVTLRDMGEHRLKSLLNPEHLWQVDVPDLSQEFPALQSLNKIPNNLPVQLTSFIGREKEISEVTQALSVHRLITLTGSGGTGKTRLCLEVAADELEHFSDGVWFIELAQLADPRLVPQTILAVLHLGEQAGKTPLKVLEEQLHRKKLLLILDNCEHLIESSARVVHALLVSAPEIKILASSREAMGVQGELAWHVPSLGLPDTKILLQIEQLAQYEAVRLFIDRATLVQPHFTVTNENAPAVAQICYRLDGIPLAIELAAARLKMLSPEQIVARLDDRFRLLTGGSRTTLPRQQTLRAMIDWSYDLLSEDEKLLLRRLAVFEGGWSLDLAEQICSDDRLEAFDILDLLGHLVDKSLLAVHEDKTGRRYRILETVRQYAREKLFETKEVKVLRDRHRDVYLAFVERIEPEIIRGEQRKWLNVIESEIDNLRSAIRWSIENNHAEQALRFCSASINFWNRRGHAAEAAVLCKDTLNTIQENDNIKTTALYASVVAEVWWFKRIIEPMIPWSDKTMLASLMEVREVFETLNDYDSVGSVIAFISLWEYFVKINDFVSAENCIHAYHERVKQAGYLWGIANSKWPMGNLLIAKGDVVSGLAWLQEALDLYVQIEDVWSAQQASNAMIYFKILRGELNDALELSKQLLLFYDDYGDLYGVSSIYLWIGDIALVQGQYEIARQNYSSATDCASEIYDPWTEIDVAERRSQLFFLEGNLNESGAGYKKLIADFSKATDDPRIGIVHVGLARVQMLENLHSEAHANLRIGLDTLQKTSPEDEIYKAYFGLGELARLENNYPEAIKNYRASLQRTNNFLNYISFPGILDGIAKTECVQSNFEKSARLLGASEALRNKMGAVIHPVDRPDYDKHLGLLKSALGAEKFASAFAEYTDMSIEAVYAYAVQELS
jgi:predicted ATPase/class 3 adenylate cyclase